MMTRVALCAVAIAGIFVLVIVGVQFETLEAGLSVQLDVKVENPVTKIWEAIGTALEVIAYITFGAIVVYGAYMYFKPVKR